MFAQYEELKATMIKATNNYHQFSAKQFKTVYKSVLPMAKQKPYGSNVQFIFRQHIQPWHPSSTLVHEAGVAVLRLAPAKFWDFSEKLFEAQNDYFDVNVVNETRNQTYRRLAKLGATVGVNEDEMYKLLEIPDKPAKDGSLNVGNAVTDDLKVLVKVRTLLTQICTSNQLNIAPRWIVWSVSTSRRQSCSMA